MFKLKISILILGFLVVLSGCTNNSSNSNPLPTNEKLIAQGDGNFGQVSFNSSSLKHFTFKNDSSATVNLLPTIIGGNFEQVSLGCQSVEPGRSCLVKVLFNANKESGTYESQLQVGSLLLPLTATIQSVPNVVYQFFIDGVENVSDLGILSGNNLKLMTVKVKNNSPKTGNLSSLLSSSNKFSLLYNSCLNISLKPNQSCFAKLVVKGDNSGTVLNTNLSFDNQGPSLQLAQETVDLSSNLQPLNSEITLGDVYKEGENRIQLLTIENQGKGIGTISDVSVPPGFTVVSNNCLSIKPGNKCVIRVAYRTSNIPTGQYNNQIDLGDDASVQVTVNQVTDPNKLNKIEILSAADVLVNTCTPVTVSLKDIDNLDYITSQSVNLISSESLFSDSNCSVLDSSMAAFEPSKIFYIKKTISGISNLNISYNNKSSQKSINWYQSLSVVINPVLITNNPVPVVVSGGKPPYVYEVLAGSGTISSDGQYQSPVPGDMVIKVTDSLNLTASAAVKVVSPLQLIAQKQTQVVLTNQSFSVSGGLLPFVYSIVSGGGTIDSATGIFTAPNNAGTVVIKVTDASNQNSQLSINIASVLSISPINSTLITNQTKNLIASGGVAPYSFSSTGVGSVNSSSGLFSAGLVSGSSFVKVTDSIGQEATANLVVVLPLASNLTSFEKIVNQSQSIIGQNGLAPYTYTKVSGVGSIDTVTGTYSAGPISGAVQLKITDALSQEVLVNGQVYAQLDISPANGIITLSQSQTFTGSGGKSPLVFSKVSGVGSVNSSGLFSSTTAGVAQIKVVDALGQEATTGITVNSDLVISAGTCSASIPEQVDCTISATGGIGTKTYSVDKGFIDSSSGVFYGQCQNNLGQSIVTVTDSMGNNSNITLNYPCVYKTCSQLRAQQKGLVSGDYWLDPDGVFKGGTTSPFKVYCDFRANGTFALMAEKKAADGFYFPTSASHGGQALGFYDFGPSANGTFSVNLRKFASIPNSLIRLEDGIYNYVMTWDGLNTFKYVSSANLSSNPPGKIWTLNNTGFVAPAVNTTLIYDYRDLAGIEDQCGMIERNGSNPHAGISRFYYVGLNPASGWNTNGSQNWCPYGLGAHGDYNYDGYAWLGGYRTASGTAIKIYYQDVYYHLPTSCVDARDKGVKNQAGTTGSGVFTIDPDGYLYGNAPFDVYCDQETDSGGWQLVAAGWIPAYASNEPTALVNMGQFIYSNGDYRTPDFKEMRHYCRRNNGSVIHRKRAYSTTSTTKNLHIFDGNAYSGNETLLPGHNTQAGSNWVQNGSYVELHYYHGDSNRFIIRPSNVHCGVNYSAVGGENNNPALGQEGMVFVR